MIDAFLKLLTTDGTLVEGESSDQDFPKAIEITGFGLGGSSSGPGLDLGDGDSGQIVGNDDNTKASVDRLFADMKRTNSVDFRKQQATLQKQVQEQIKKAADEQKKLVQARMSDLKAKVEDDAREKARRSAGDPADKLTFQIRKDIDAASADLFLAYCSTILQPMPRVEHRKLGRFGSAVISFRRAGGAVGPGAATTRSGKPYLVFSFENVGLSNYSLDFSDSSGTLIENLTFTFVRYKCSYVTQADTGGAGAANPEVSGTTADLDA